MANDQGVTAPRRLDPRVEYRLDQELEQTFPASDAPQITRDCPPYRDRPRRRSKAPAVKGKAVKPGR
jgi:hypothetical protein